MANAEQTFNSCSLNLVIPDSLLQIPQIEPDFDADGWIERLKALVERKTAFFDEKLPVFLTVRLHDVPSSSKESSYNERPPPHLLTFLSHLQVSLEASYIPSQVSQEDPESSQVKLPPIASLGKPKGLVAPLSIIPPQTPSPVPSASENDKKYVYSGGTVINSIIWGEDRTETDDSFRLLWSKQENVWVAIYRLSVSVVFVRTSFEDYLLCLTASITLRDKPMSATPQRRTLNELVAEAGSLPSITSGIVSKSTSKADGPPSYDKCQATLALNELNLFQDIVFDTSSSDPLHFPTSRLGPSARRAYCLQPIFPRSATAPTANLERPIPILRKSFRKTLKPVSGFRVRMRTVFVPHVSSPAQADSKFEEQETVSEECMVILCVEIENSGESGAGFLVESINVTMSGEGWRISLIGWGERGFSEPEEIFPLFIRSMEQYNLLYAVSFVRPNEMELSTSQENADYQRAVSINIDGRPFYSQDSEYTPLDNTAISYPAASFLSRWNCVLDLSPRLDQEVTNDVKPESSAQNALPCPVSPFPFPYPHTRALATPKTNTSGFRGRETGRDGPSNFSTVPSSAFSPINPRTAGLSPPLPPLPTAIGLFGSAAAVTSPSSAFSPSALTPRLSASRDFRLAPAPPKHLSETQGSNSDFVVLIRLVADAVQETPVPGPLEIFSLDEFCLEIFIFNRSEHMRTLEANYTGEQHRDTAGMRNSYLMAEHRSRPAAAFIPLESQICIGPLGPLTCQSVRMKFLALSPGIHSIDGLTLTDVTSGSVIRLRSVMDFAILSRGEKKALLS